ncbi:hypothetical protein KQX54_016404 [Cotesia glomerata]|uniref:Uncharacterized protein n=1 Tax=Cotesia glomerata TaxID=32391 RepID=A0AAV7I6I1_COTGL|nr:hypothetical protein KQX54_016404 [Cotesia glomerata]
MSAFPAGLSTARFTWIRRYCINECFTGLAVVNGRGTVLLLFCVNEFFIVNSEIAETYELKLDNNDSDIKKFANDAWFKIDKTQYYRLKTVARVEISIGY